MNELESEKNWWDTIPNFPDINQVRLKDVDWAKVEDQIFRDAARGLFKNHLKNLDLLTKVPLADPASLASLYHCLQIVHQKKGDKSGAEFWFAELIDLCKYSPLTAFNTHLMEAEAYMYTGKIESASLSDKALDFLVRSDELRLKSGHTPEEREKRLASMWRQGIWTRRMDRRESSNLLCRHWDMARQTDNTDQIANAFISRAYIGAMEDDPDEVVENAWLALKYYVKEYAIRSYAGAMALLGFGQLRRAEKPTCYLLILLAQWLTCKLGVTDLTEGLGESLGFGKQFCPEGLSFYQLIRPMVVREWPNCPIAKYDDEYLFLAAFKDDIRTITYAWRKMEYMTKNVTPSAVGFQPIITNLDKNEGIFRASSGEMEPIRLTSSDVPRFLRRSTERKLTLLHLSDIQFGEKHVYKNNDRDTILGELEKALESFSSLGRAFPDIIIVSGDIADKGSEKEYDDALEFLRKLCSKVEELSGKAIPPNRVILTPGNHDIDLYEPALNGIEYYQVDGLSLPKTEFEQVYVRRFGNFKRFFDKFYGGFREWDLNRGFSVYNYSTLRDWDVCIVSLNSCIRVHKGQKMGFIDIRNIETAASLNSDVRVKIAVFHHSVRPVTNPRTSLPNPDYLQNASDVMDVLVKRRFAACLHGHVHNPDLRPYYTPAGSKVVVFGAGTVGVAAKYRHPGAEVEIYPRSFNLLTLNLRPPSAQIYADAWHFLPTSPGSRGGWIPDGDIKGPYDLPA
jgi:3',5'-cyclic AMP phosphodiesterase CpdA